jgi:hypothetical protein
MSDLSPEVRRQLGYEVEEDFISEAEAPWVEASGVSHVKAHRYIEDEDGPKIDVQFKPNGSSGVRQYRYKFAHDQRDAAQMIYEMLGNTDHPGIEIWAYLIRGGVPYEETAVS